MTDWEVTELRGPASQLHHRPLEAGPRRLEVLLIDRPALALGSTQPAGDVDAAAAEALGVEVVRRRSGGGAVLLLPGDDLWIDVSIGRDDPLWDDDLGRSFHWFGHCWRDALATFGVAAEVHHGGLRSTPWSRLVCFAGMGAGEVTAGGRKVVGLSQRRTRDTLRIQCAVLGAWDPVALLALLALDGPTRARALHEIAEVATGAGHPPAALLSALLLTLPS